MTIRSRDELPGINSPDVKSKSTGNAATFAESPRPVWEIPPPPEGSFYRRAEVAAIARVGVTRVDQWRTYGQTVNGKLVKLRALQNPRGAILPTDLCAFLEHLSGRKVQVNHELSIQQ